jgi:ribosomal protein S10
MKHYQIIISSKNKKSLDKFIKFFTENLSNFIIINNFFKTKLKTKIITILKSPHVNKKAQEQFKINIFYKTINISTPKNFKLLTYLKNINSHLFTDIKIKLKLLINYKLSKKIYNNILNPTNFNTNIFNKTKVYKNKKIEQNNNFIIKKKLNNIYEFNKSKNLIKINKILKIFDIYGELANKK